MYNSTLEIWTFDRAGAVSSEAFSIAKKPDDFARILARNTSLNAGLQQVLKEDDQGVFVEIADSPRLYLEEDTFFKPDFLFGPGTICFKARAAHTRGRNLVVKFVWTETGSAGKKLLALTNIKLEAYRDLGDIASLQHRQRLQLCESYKFHLKNQEDEASVTVQATPVVPSERDTFNSMLNAQNSTTYNLSASSLHLSDDSSIISPPWRSSSQYSTTSPRRFNLCILKFSTATSVDRTLSSTLQCFPILLQEYSLIWMACSILRNLYQSISC